MDGKDIVTLEKQNTKASLTIKESSCQNIKTCKIYAKLDVNGNGKYEGEFVVSYDANMTANNGDDGGAEYSGVYIDYTKKINGVAKKHLANCVVSN